MKKFICLFIAVLICVSLCSCGEPKYTGPVSYYDERVQDDVFDACGCLENANWDIDKASDSIKKLVENGKLSEDDARILLNHLMSVRQDVQEAGEYLGYW